MNRDIYVMDLENQAMLENELDAEAYGLEHLVDDDDYGDRDGDEDY